MPNSSGAADRDDARDLRERGVGQLRQRPRRPRSGSRAARRAPATGRAPRCRPPRSRRRCAGSSCRALGEAAVRLGEQLVAVAEERRALRAGLGAGGRLALGLAGGAEVALDDRGHRVVPLVLGNAERAGLHAVAAAHAAAGVVDDRAFRRLAEGLDRADADAGGRHAVPAELADVDAVRLGERGQRRRRQPGDRVGVTGQVVGDEAGGDALLAADAAGQVDQQTPWKRW